jgi:uncharacterized cupin superfamily protein
MPKIEIATAALRTGTSYPPPHDTPCLKRERRRLGDAVGLSQFGVNLLRLPPGAWSSQRHWHSREDEFVWVVSGEVVLVEDSGRTVLRAGDCAGWTGGARNGHHLRNESDQDALVLEVGSRLENEEAEYSDIDMRVGPDGRYTRKDGKPY